jgi:hypothetical protein
MDSPCPPREHLIEAWQQLFGRPPPKGLSSRLMHLACEYQRQVQEQGGLSKAKLRELRSHAQMSATVNTDPPVKPSPAPLQTGTRLVREWRGRTHVVEVGDAGLVYDGRSYRSLSEIARAITGARWSGPRFFGVG